MAERAQPGTPRYMVLYEVASLATLTSQPYLQRLNNPTPWTTRVMPHYRGMRRGLCAVLGSFGFGCGHAGALLRFQAEARGAEAAVHRWLLQDVLPALPAQPGIGSAHLLEGAAAAAMTHEQRMRGAADASVDSALVITGYDSAAVAALALSLASGPLERQGATGVSHTTYRVDYALAATELQR